MQACRLPEVARLSGRDGLELVMPAVLDALLVLGTEAQASLYICIAYSFAARRMPSVYCLAQAATMSDCSWS